MLYDQNGTSFIFSLIKALHVVLIRNEDLSKGQWSILKMITLELNWTPHPEASINASYTRAKLKKLVGLMIQ